MARITSFFAMTEQFGLRYREEFGRCGDDINKAVTSLMLEWPASVNKKVKQLERGLLIVWQSAL